MNIWLASLAPHEPYHIYCLAQLMIVIINHLSLPTYIYIHMYIMAYVWLV